MSANPLLSAVAVRLIGPTDAATFSGVLAVERACEEPRWDGDDLAAAWCEPNVCGLVAAVGPSVIGYVLWQQWSKSFQILNVAVLPDRRRLGVGGALVDRLKVRALCTDRRRLKLTVRESNLPAQLFFKAQGFKATRVIPAVKMEDDEDSYLMVYELTKPPPQPAE